MRRNTFLLFLFIFFINGIVSAQKIDLFFPHFAGIEYDFFVFEGTKNDTITSGVIDEKGHVTLILPEKYKDYRGMGRWMLKDRGGLDFIVNGTDFSISCVDAVPSEKSIIYSKDEENYFLRNQLTAQQNLLKKIEGLLLVDEAYKGQENCDLCTLIQRELITQKSIYEKSIEEIISSSLYASYYCRINDFYRQVPLYTIYDRTDENAKLDNQKRFVEQELNMDALYTSGLWSHVISQTFDLYPVNADFGVAMTKALERAKSQKIFEQFAEDLIIICEQFDWQDANEIITSYLLNSQRIKEPKGQVAKAFSAYQIRPGAKAPEIKGVKLKNKLVIFHETGCHNCSIQLEELIKHHDDIKKKGYDVVSISADLDSSTFEKTAAKFPWKDKLCDYKGFKGGNFLNYSIYGTPTIIIVDNKGIIQGRYARLKDTGLLD